jgi:hypothetical protein
VLQVGENYKGKRHKLQSVTNGGVLRRTAQHASPQKGYNRLLRSLRRDDFLQAEHAMVCNCAVGRKKSLCDLPDEELVGVRQ